jgi:hypothetical protein
MNGSASKCLYQLESSPWSDQRLYTSYIPIFYINDPPLDINPVSRLVLVMDNCNKITAELDVVILQKQQNTSLQS